MSAKHLPMVLLVPRTDARPIDNAKVVELADSFILVGMLEPIIVRRMRGSNGDTYEIIAGLHRVTAMRDILHGVMIVCQIVDFDDDTAELAMIDENLIRVALSAAQTAKLLARRKILFLKRFPETRAGVAGANASKGSPNDKLSFAAATAAATGKSKRTIERSVSRGEALSSTTLDNITGTPLDTGVAIDALAKLNPEEQEAISQRSARGEMINLADLVEAELPGQDDDDSKARVNEGQLRGSGGSAKSLAERLFEHAMDAALDHIMRSTVADKDRAAYDMCCLIATDRTYEASVMIESFKYAGVQLVETTFDLCVQRTSRPDHPSVLRLGD